MKYLVFAAALCAAGPVCAGDLKIMEAWIARAPPGAKVHAAYVTAMNPGDAPVALIGVEAEGYAMAHLHESKETNGIATMAMLHQISVPAGGHLHMEPGGLHMMLMAPTAAQVEGEMVTLTLGYADGATQRIEAAIKARPTTKAEDLKPESKFAASRSGRT